MRVLMPRLRRWVWSSSGDVIDCILVGLFLAVLSCLGSLGVFEFSCSLWV